MFAFLKRRTVRIYLRSGQTVKVRCANFRVTTDSAGSVVKWEAIGMSGRRRRLMALATVDIVAVRWR